MLRKPTAAELAEARKAEPVFHPATPVYRASWSVANPRGAEIHYPTREDALAAARTGIY
jgi:hypothetical protein